MVSMLHSLRSSAQCQSLGVIRLPHHSRTGLRHVEQIMSAFTVLTALAFISRAGATIPPVNKTYPYDSETSSCFFMGRASTFRINYNINADICVSFYGRLEMDAKMEESELQEINSIEGCVIISGTKIEHADLRQIQHIRPNPEFCEYTHALLIYNNRDLKSIEFTNQLTLDRPEDVFIGLNPALTPAGVTGASFKFDFTSEKDCLITEVTPKSKCTRIVGDVRVEQLSTDLWEQIRVVHGTLRIENSDLPYLNSLSNLKIEAWKLPALVISKNSQLIDISALLTMEIEPKENFFEIRDNPNICHNIVERKMLEKWLASRNVSVQFKTDCLTSCFGGSVSIGYLEGIDKLCNTIKGDLRIEGIKKLPENMDNLEQIERIIGRLIVRNNVAVPDLRYLKNLKIINNSESEEPGLLIENNTNFKNTGMVSLEKVINKVKPTTPKAEEEKTGAEEIFTTSESSTLQTTTENLQTGTGMPHKKTSDPLAMRKKIAKQLLDSVFKELDEEQKKRQLSQAKDAKIIWLVAIILLLCVLAAIIGILSAIWYKKRTDRMMGKGGEWSRSHNPEKKSGAPSGTQGTDLNRT